MASKERWALDTSVILAYLKGTEIIRMKPASEYSLALIRRAENGEALIVVSSLAMVEVCKPHRKSVIQGGVEDGDAVDDFFRRSFVEVVELDRTTGRVAQELTNTLGIPSWDAVHLATAIRARSSYLFSWDFGDLIRHSPVQGVEIREPFADLLPGPMQPVMQQSELLGTD